MNLTEEEIKLMQEIKSMKISKERFAELVKEEVSEYNKKLNESVEEGVKDDTVRKKGDVDDMLKRYDKTMKKLNLEDIKATVQQVVEEFIGTTKQEVRHRGYRGSSYGGKKKYFGDPGFSFDTGRNQPYRLKKDDDPTPPEKVKKQSKKYEPLSEEVIQEREQSLANHLQHGALFEDGEAVNEEWLYETIAPALCECPDLMPEAEYRGRKVKLNKIMRGDVKKFKVFVKDPKTGNVKKVNFGHGGSSARKKGEKTMRIRKSNPKARKNFRARHNCDNPGPKTKARNWSCRKW